MHRGTTPRQARPPALPLAVARVAVACAAPKDTRAKSVREKPILTTDQNIKTITSVIIFNLILNIYWSKQQTSVMYIAA